MYICVLSFYNLYKLDQEAPKCILQEGTEHLCRCNKQFLGYLFFSTLDFNEASIYKEMNIVII